MSARKKTLRERAMSLINTYLYTGWDIASFKKWFEDAMVCAYEAGYRAAQRDRRARR